MLRQRESARAGERARAGGEGESGRAPAGSAGVASAVQKASFAKTQTGGSFAYPFPFLN